MEPRIDLMANEVGAKIAKRIYNVSVAIQRAPLAASTQELVMLRVSQINGCGWCVDVHTKEAAVAGESPLRLNLLAAWRHATVFSEAERAALALAEEATRLADGGDVSDATWAQLREHYDEDELAALVSVVAMINATNRMSVIAGFHGGAYEPGMFAAVEA